LTHNHIRALLNNTCLTDADQARIIHRSEEDSTKRLYWDGGPKKIELFMAHHLKECENNPICNSLHLMTVEFEDEPDLGKGKNSKSPLQKHTSAKKKMFVDDYDIVHSD
jgi:hypothetical protein